MFKRKVLFFLLLLMVGISNAQILNKKAIFKKFTFWQNRDWQWYSDNIPFIETPDRAIDETYYYRFELMTAHMVYGSPKDGYAFTEFIDRPWWSGTYGAISCAAGLQMYDLRWLRDETFAKDYANYWFFVKGAQPRNYSTWIADAVWQIYKNYSDKAFIKKLLPALSFNYFNWEKEHYISKEKLFAWDGMHDGMETNINSRQTENWFSGAPGYRPTLNSYMYADAMAIYNINHLLGDTLKANLFLKKAMSIKDNFQKKCWDSQRQFFFHRFVKDEKDGVKANSLTYETGKYAGNEHGREEIGFIPWYFNMPDSGYEQAWKYIMDEQYFNAPYGPTTVEQGDPLFNVAKNCCAWSGNAWPFATSQTIGAMAHLLRGYKNLPVNKADYYELLKKFTFTQRKDGEPYIAEANNPYNGSWDGHDKPGHSDHYFHSSYIDLVLSGLLGVQPLPSDSLSIYPLTPDDWDYFAIDGLRYHGCDVSVVWDKYGNKYNKGKGLSIWRNGIEIFRTLNFSGGITIPFKPGEIPDKQTGSRVNVAVNNAEDAYYPKAFASVPGLGKDYLTKLNDGQYWYYERTSNRWSNLGQKGGLVYAGIDFGIEEEINEVKIYFIDNGKSLFKPNGYYMQYWAHNKWNLANELKRIPGQPAGASSNTIIFTPVNTTKIRIVCNNRNKTGISEIEAWGPKEKYKAPPREQKSIDKRFIPIDSVSVSFISKYDDISSLRKLANGSVKPSSRWTNYESPQQLDSMLLYFKDPVDVSAIYMFFYDDHKGVQPPSKYQVNYMDNSGRWMPVKKMITLPVRPIADLNVCQFSRVTTRKICIKIPNIKPGVFAGLYGVQVLNAREF